MPTKLKIALFGIVPIVACDLLTHYYRRKYAEIARVAIDLDKENDLLRAQMVYLVTVINENNIELDEFDMIALNNASLTED